MSRHLLVALTALTVIFDGADIQLVALAVPAITADWHVPRSAFAVTLTIVCVPLGGALAALIASQVLPAFGWRALFGLGGAMPLVVAALALVRRHIPRYFIRS